MSFDSKNFSVMAYANGFTLWNYSTPDTMAAVKTAGYFNDVAPFARPGDMIMVNAAVETTLAPAIFSVSSVTGGTVTVVSIAEPGTPAA